MKVEEFDYELPEELIAQKPLPNRDDSRLMVLHRKTGEIEETVFKNIIKFLEPGDLLVLNDTKVIPARLFGEKIPSGTRIEVLLLKSITEGLWEVLVRPGRRMKKGNRVSFGDGKLVGIVKDYTDFGGRIMQFEYDGDFDKVIEELGEMPLPPYITRKVEDKGRYQTVYARKKGSVAAPTAGLHFTDRLLKKIKEQGIGIIYLTLHVGLGTFRPVRAENVEDHKMHSEYFEVSTDVVNRIKETKEKGKKVIAVGTTVTRALESAAVEKRHLKAMRGWTDIFIYPGYNFKVIDGLITNFHLPKSTLLMLVSAFAGKDMVMSAYKLAIKNKYRFFSFGDAMLIL
ncbi:tRNA preQ1(34) S-adenosylmethionine ribosyltransferase-isomerase QueA [Halothermothrix orenii]|uniref:S-adenosylmethionine:tRNA ribosyltransferase-isomerase n=1 Tax=Halothermothrix orenii (strain H 168 / OCM 544 / DSM 9562) TaxID=373903 RepID=QUEA_HALOH|nr:tRNA preQ1(34) S-adenosylmethionine ribosyltransferase-isomerase QueA [Halothermothrix orenii]B8CXG1.1 RecName: Full=S-adenosylmethionine:tRNA ribosyltransferase-isomerase; AltName: Full=Queuosine biosynthesis protein QueA [Halothermothrix orenii H 168]ACL69980.1 S-adenosylmethionine--tRNA-ribosyltransferase-isomerase [Halothermothrix orenii H 168]